MEENPAADNLPLIPEEPNSWEVKAPKDADELAADEVPDEGGTDGEAE